MTGLFDGRDDVADGFAATVGAPVDGVITVCVSGEVDMATSPQLDDAIAGAQSTHPAVLLDLRQVTFLGSAGLSVLVESARRADESQGALAVLPGIDLVRRAIEVTGLDAALRLFTDPASAAGYLQAVVHRTGRENPAR